MSSKSLPLKLTFALVGTMMVLGGAVYASGAHRGGHMFDRIDANGDDTITRDELSPVAEKRFARFDGDEDGVVTSAEIDAYLMRRVERRRDHILSRFDTDADGNVTLTELDASITDMFERADADDDGQLSREEARSAHSEMHGNRHGDDDQDSDQ